MPADRRDAETPHNDRTDLEVWLRVKGPDFLRRNAANLVLVVAVLIALGFLLYSRQRNKQVESMAVQQNAAAAYDFATQLRQSLTGATNAEAGRERQQRAHDALTSADVVLGSDAASPAQKAIAQLVKADVYWALANAPAQALATTQPVVSFNPKAPDAYLADAESAYGEVLRSYAEEPEPVAGALMSLAAIAENRRDFDKAAEWYRRAIGETLIRQAYRDAATARLAQLDVLRKPVTLATTRPSTQPSQPPMIFRLPGTTVPTTAPAAEVGTAIEPAIEPATVPAVAAVAEPSVSPATSPATLPPTTQP